MAPEIVLETQRVSELVQHDPEKIHADRDAIYVKYNHATRTTDGQGQADDSDSLAV